MPSSTSPLASRDAHAPRLTLALWTGLLAGPLLFLLLLEVNYVFSYLACEVQTTWFLHAATAVAVALILAAGVWGWRAGQGFTDPPHASTDPASPRTASTRVNWMTLGVVLSALWFALATVSLDIPAMVLRPCQ